MRRVDRSIEDGKSTRTPLLWLAGLFLFGLAVRVWRLEWQPLWWDEGYSVYFATEPLRRMLWLTAHDIHPPLYYALLHGWTAALGGIGALGGGVPVVVRTLSVAVGAASVPAIVWLGRVIFPRQRYAAWIGALLLAVSPMHLFYSQEVRMYALAMLLSILASGALWVAVGRLRAGRPALRALVGYGVAGTLLLYTLYYGALVLLAHGVWLGWVLWRHRSSSGALSSGALTWRQARGVVVTWLVMGLAYLPWLVYAAPKLIGYVAAKVESDQDVVLGPVAYVVRHLSAFVVGHVDAQGVTVQVALWVGLAGLLLLLGILLATRSEEAGAYADAEAGEGARLSGVEALTVWLVVPIVCAFAISLRNPFFPVGSERLLLVVLPCFLLLVAYGCDVAITRSRALGRAASWLAVGLVAGAGVAGVAVFYLTPRYVEEDYRPLLADVARMGRDEDALVAIFPWQVGYWRAYKPAEIAGPRERLLGDFAVTWGEEVRAALEASLAQGSVWFPEPLAFGSTLPEEMEGWLAEHAANLENRWYSPTTRLTAWADLPLLQARQPAAAFGELTLFGSSAGAEGIAANTPVAVTLVWDAIALEEVAVLEDGEVGATLRLVDEAGRTWASRDYAPIGNFAQRAEGELPLAVERLGLGVPAGMPPGLYGLYLGVKQGESLVEAAVDGFEEPQTLVQLGEVTVDLPAVAPAVVRLPMAHPLARPATMEGMTILGATLPEADIGERGAEILAGEMLDVAVFARRASAEESGAVDRQLRLRLAGRGAGTEWIGSPLEGYPVSAWRAGFATTLPVSMPLPAWLPSWKYWVLASWVDESGATTEEVALGSVTIRQREASFVEEPLAEVLPVPAQFATHALLKSYEARVVEGRLEVRLGWEVMQPILPPHEIFVHLDVEGAAPQTGAQTVAQADGAPQTAAGRAPTGTWQPGEELITVHSILLPEGGVPEGARVRVGLFEPSSGVRLPVSIEGAPVGDFVELPATF